MTKARANQASFDTSLDAFICALAKVLPPATIIEGWIVRDASGRLAFIANNAIEDSLALEAMKQIKKVLPDYSRGSYSILHRESPGISPLVEGRHFKIKPRSADLRRSIPNVRVIDRRIVGQDWLKAPSAGWQPPSPARFVFASMKGGVGRSTAIAVLATELAQRNLKVLVVDLDLEAPGIGTLLIDEKDKPKFGIIDWYVENGVSGRVDSEFLSDMVAPSTFGDGKGLIDVAPAVGKLSDEYPENVLGKLARAYLDVPSNDNNPKSFLILTQELIGQLLKQKTYDVLLVDARAGLNESTAACILGLGADVLLFGVDTPQTYASYRYLLAHLALFERTPNDDWMYRLKMVHAKASPVEASQNAFRDNCYEIFSALLYADKPLVENGDTVIDKKTNKPLYDSEISLNDENGPHYAWHILFDSSFVEFDPIGKRPQLAGEYYQRSYKNLIEEINDRLGLKKEQA
jgi:Mrp family chromosome partitioning ATPase